MGKTRFGIRVEDKDDWERRVPLTPNQVAAAARNSEVGFVVQPSSSRIFPDEEYRQAGAEVASGALLRTVTSTVIGVEPSPRAGKSPSTVTSTPSSSTP